MVRRIYAGFHSISSVSCHEQCDRISGSIPSGIGQPDSRRHNNGYGQLNGDSDSNNVLGLQVRLAFIQVGRQGEILGSISLTL